MSGKSIFYVKEAILPGCSDTFLQVDVPGDGTCWLYGVMLGTLLPLLSKPQEFQKAFKELFGETIQADTIEEHRLLLFQYDGTLSFLKEKILVKIRFIGPT